MTSFDGTPLVSIILLNYNAGILLEECINSIYKTNYKNYEIILVDNDSKDNNEKVSFHNYENLE